MHAKRLQDETTGRIVVPGGAGCCKVGVSHSGSIYIYKYAGERRCCWLALKNRNQKLRNNLHVYLIAGRIERPNDLPPGHFPL